MLLFEMLRNVVTFSNVTSCCNIFFLQHNVTYSYYIKCEHVEWHLYGDVTSGWEILFINKTMWGLIGPLSLVQSGFTLGPVFNMQSDILLLSWISQHGLKYLNIHHIFYVYKSRQKNTNKVLLFFKMDPFYCL